MRSSMLMGMMLQFFIPGIGVNVTNKKPTVNVNDIINDYNRACQAAINDVTVEWMAAKICTETEKMIGQ